MDKMSKSEELRKKILSGKKFDFKRIEFVGKINAIIIQKGANVGGARNQWLNEIYERYKNKPEALSDEEWILSETRELFLSENLIPEWIFEPTWCFYNERPMIFVGQLKHDKYVMYIFKIVDQASKNIVFKMVMQYQGGEVVLNGEVRTE